MKFYVDIQKNEAVHIEERNLEILAAIKMDELHECCLSNLLLVGKLSRISNLIAQCLYRENEKVVVMKTLVASSLSES